MVTVTLWRTFHPTVTAKEAAAPAETEAVGLIFAQEPGHLVDRHQPGLSHSLTLEMVNIRHQGGNRLRNRQPGGLAVAHQGVARQQEHRTACRCKISVGYIMVLDLYYMYKRNVS